MNEYQIGTINGIMSCNTVSITGRISGSVTLSGRMSSAVAPLRGEVKVPERCEPYIGPYIVTPTQEVQVLSTRDKSMTSDVTINPIPNNYGLITYNGYELTVS